jgi:hypothetical protein
VFLILQVVPELSTPLIAHAGAGAGATSSLERQCWIQGRKRNGKGKVEKIRQKWETGNEGID